MWRSKNLVIITLLSLLTIAIGGLYVEHRRFEIGRRTLMQSTESNSAILLSTPINKDWIIEGTPITESREIARSYDDSTHVYIWRTTAAKFKWVYDADEVVTILDGDAFITDTDGTTRHLKAGDVALFPVGAVLNWDVPHHVLKSAIVKRSGPKPVEAALRLFRAVRGFFVPDNTVAF